MKRIGFSKCSFIFLKPVLGGELLKDYARTIILRAISDHKNEHYKGNVV